MLTPEATLFVDTFVRMARHVPTSPTDRDKEIIWVALNHYLDGLQGVLEGTHQGWTTASDEAVSEFFSSDSSFVTAETPEAVLEQAVDIMGMVVR